MLPNTELACSTKNEELNSKLLAYSLEPGKVETDLVEAVAMFEKTYIGNVFFCEGENVSLCKNESVYMQKASLSFAGAISRPKTEPKTKK